MSLIVLEGLNGVGKSVHAEALSEALGTPVVKPLGRSLGVDGRHQNALRSLGIPANTFVDDIYVADLLAATGASAVLDQSIGSALAYGTMYKDIATVRRATRLLALWQELIEPYDAPLLYVHMAASHEVRAERCKGRWSPSEDQERHLKSWFKRVYGSLKIPKMSLDTSGESVDEGVRAILRYHGGTGGKNTR